jgi:hypothetical protein
MACHRNWWRPHLGRYRRAPAAGGSRIGDLAAGVLGGQCVLDAGDRPVGAHEPDHAPKPGRACGRSSRSRAGIALGQRPEHRRNRVHAARGRIDGNRRLGHVDLPGSQNETSESQIVLPAPQLRADLTVDALHLSFYSTHQTNPNHRPRRLAQSGGLPSRSLSQPVTAAGSAGSRARRRDSAGARMGTSHSPSGRWRRSGRDSSRVVEHATGRRVLGFMSPRRARRREARPTRRSCVPPIQRCPRRPK